MTGPRSPHLSRRTLLASAIAAASAPWLASCGSKGTSGGGGTDPEQLSKILPNYIQNTSVEADIPGVVGKNGAVSDPVFLAYPKNPVQTVSGVPGSGGTYTTMTPLWGAIPPSAGNKYYEAVNAALGATLQMQPADGNTYGDKLPPLFAARQVPDWIQIPGWNTGPLDFGKAVEEIFADLTPFLSGSKVEEYPNLANIPESAWAAGVWNGKLYGMPVYPSGAGITGTYFYRKDIFDQLGINADTIKTPYDLAALGKELTAATAGRWAFDDLFGDDAAYVCQAFGFPVRWKIDSSGALVHKYETEELLEALEWHAKLVADGVVHPEAVAGQSQNAKQRFWSGNVAVCTDGTGAWNGDDASSGTAANPNYNRQAFKLMSAKGTPTVELQPGSAMFAYLNKRLSEEQVRECLAIANYIAAPYGSKEWLLVNYGTEGVHYTMVDGNPVLTELGGKEVATTFQFLVTPPTPTTVKGGFVQVAKDFGAWQADMVQYAVKPVFFGMNIVEPAQYASIGQPVRDTMADVRLGRKPLSAFVDAVKTWRAAGGDRLREFYDGIREKYGTGQ